MIRKLLDLLFGPKNPVVWVDEACVRRLESKEREYMLRNWYR